MITVTAATGQYGGLVIDALLKRGVPAAGIVAAVRNPQKAAGLSERGVQVREADYDRPETLVPAFTGASKLLKVWTGTLWLESRSWMFPLTSEGVSAFCEKLRESTLVSGPILNVSARCGTLRRCGGPQ